MKWVGINSISIGRTARTLTDSLIIIVVTVLRVKTSNTTIMMFSFLVYLRGGLVWLEAGICNQNAAEA